MGLDVRIRDFRPADAEEVAALYRAAFPQEDLLPLVEALSIAGQPAIALVACAGETIAGHAALTACGIEGGSGKAFLLGPVAVSPPLQGRGLGSALVQAALACAGEDGQVHVLGDPAFYSRFGFVAEHEVEAPFRLPQEWLGAWRARGPANGDPLRKGRLLVPAPWLDPALWR